MFCKHCGKDIGKSTTRFCPYCGEKVRAGKVALKKTVTSEWVPSKKSRRLAIMLWVGLPVMLLLTLFLRVVIGFFTETIPMDLDSMSDGIESPESVTLTAFQFILDFAALLFVIGIILSIPLGIVLCCKKEQVRGTFDPRSGKGSASIIPEEIQGWNWGAAGIGLLWGVYYNVWISLFGIVLNIIPGIDIIWFIILGVKGNEWAWRKNKWESVEAFKKAQRKWQIWGIVFFILSIIGFLGRIQSVLESGSAY